MNSTRRSPARAPLRADSRQQRRTPEMVSGRRVPPARDLFPPCPAEDEPCEQLFLAGWVLAMAAIATVADLVAMYLVPALTLPLYTLVVASCVLAAVLAILAESEIDRPS